MYKAFEKRNEESQKMLPISDVFGRNHQLELYFFKNPGVHQFSFQIDFQQLFFYEWEIETASNGEMTCPFLKKLPD